MNLKQLFASALVALGLAVPATAAPLVVGGKNFTEQQLIAEITTQLLTAKGFQIDKRAGLGTAPLRQALEAGQIDLYWEYTGTSLITFNKIEEKMDAAQTYAKVKELDGAKGLVWLNPSKVNSTYAIAMRASDAKDRGIATISHLAAKINGGEELTFGSNAEFYARPDGLKPLEKLYGFEYGRANVKRMDTGLVYQALKDGQVDSGQVFATDGRIPAFDFVVLTDDKGYFPSYAMTPVVRQDILDANPTLTDLLNDLSGRLDDTSMTALNSQVDVDKKTVEAVATEFLTAQGLL